MALNSVSPANFTTGVIIADTTRPIGGSPDSITATLTPGACLDIQSTKGGFLLPRLTNAEIAALPATPNGLMLYDTDLEAVTIYENGGATFLNTLPVLSSAATFNIYMGFNVGNSASLATSSSNVIFSSDQSAQVITTGSKNIAFGSIVLTDITTGGGNTAVGYNALALITTQSGNVGIGNNTFNLASNAVTCTAVGFDACVAHTNITDCTFLGHGADTDADGLTNATAIGAGALVHTSNSMVLGLVGSTNVGIGTSSPTSALHAVSAASAISCQGSFLAKVHTNAGTPYNIAANDFFVAQTATAGAISLVLPAISGNTGVLYTIKDQSGAAATHNITISTTGGKTIDGAATQKIDKNFGWISVYNDGTQWFIYNRDFLP